MSFLAPYSLLALLALPLAAWLYWRLVGRGFSSGHALYPGLGALASAPGAAPGWRLHLPALLYLAALALGVVGLARPQAVVLAPDERAGVVLAIDVSGSMRAEDIAPNRLEAAKSAATAFVNGMPGGVKVGLVSFAGYAVLDAPLTDRHAEVAEKIGFLGRRTNTAIGEGLMESLRAFPAEGGKTLGPATVILLSDGQNRTGVPPQQAAAEAARLGVRVHTIGVGTSGDGTGPGFDEAELRGIADATGGRYYAVNSAERLAEVYRELGRLTAWAPQRSEVTGLFALGAGLLLASSLLLGHRARRVV